MASGSFFRRTIFPVGWRLAGGADISLITNVYGIGTCGIARRDWQSQCLCDGIFLGLLDLAQLFFAFSLLTLRICFIRVAWRRVCFGVPIQVAALLPSSNRCFEAVTEVVFAVVGVCDFIPAEVDTSSRSRFPDAGEQIHRRKVASIKDAMISFAERTQVWGPLGDSGCDVIGGAF